MWGLAPVFSYVGEGLFLRRPVAFSAVWIYLLSLFSRPDFFTRGPNRRLEPGGSKNVKKKKNVGEKKRMKD